ncbi:hypothetical protein [Kitasatospora sp. NPDC059327]|uniref:hypothetical protein n=1 Tax=Kitasatospora sp. NPDC059327 TaxID=3346803 RepID=UPI003698DCE9
MTISTAECQALDGLADRLAAHRTSLPSTAIPFRLPEPAVVARQLGELGHLIAETSTNFHKWITAEPSSESSIRAATAFAAATDHLGQVVSALGAITSQHACFARTEALRDRPDVAASRKTVLRVLDLAVSNAQEELDEAIGRLRAESSTITQLAGRARLQAALPHGGGPPVRYRCSADVRSRNLAIDRPEGAVTAATSQNPDLLLGTPCSGYGALNLALQTTTASFSRHGRRALLPFSFGLPERASAIPVALRGCATALVS